MGERDHSVECENCGVSYGGLGAADEEHACDDDRDVALNWTPEFIHDLCTDDGATCYDERCLQHVALPLMRTLAANLAVVGALTKSYRLGTAVLAIGSDAWQPNVKGDVGWWLR